MGTVVRGAGLAGAGYLFGQALNLGVYVALSRLLDPIDFGLYASATVLIAFGVLITESGMLAAVVQRHDRVEEAQSTAAAATFVGGIVFGLLALAAAPLLGVIFDSSRVTALAAVASGLILINTISVVPLAVLQRRFSTLTMTLVAPLEVIAFGAVAIALAIAGMGPWALLIGQFAGFVTSTGLFWILARWRPRVSQMSFAMWRELASYGRHVLISTAIQRVGTQAADAVIIGRSLGSPALGQFRYAFRVATFPYTVLIAGAGYVIFPALSRIAADRDRLQAAFLRSLRWMTAFGFPAGLVLVPLGPSITVIVFGDVWEPAGQATVALAAYAGATAISATVSELLKANGTPAPLTMINAVITLTTAAGMLALVGIDLTAAAAGFSIGAVAGACYSVWVVRRQLGVRVGSTLSEIWAPMLAATAMALAVLPVDRLLLDPAAHGLLTGLALLAVEGLLCVAVYAGVLAVLAPDLLRELGTVLQAQRRNLRSSDLELVDEPGPDLLAP